MRAVQMIHKKGAFKELEIMSEVERLEFEFDWLHAQIAKLEKEAWEIGLKLAELKGEQCPGCSDPLISKEAKEKGLCQPCWINEVGR